MCSRWVEHIIPEKKRGLILISGSMKYRLEMIALANKLRTEKCVKIIEPSDNRYIESTDLIDKAKNHQIFEGLIEKADSLLIFNKNGYIGLSTAMEIQKALDCKVPVRLLFEPEAIEFKALCAHPDYDIKVYQFINDKGN